MSPESEVKQLQAVMELLAAKAEEWHEINLHEAACDLENVTCMLACIQGGLEKMVEPVSLN